MAYLQWSIWAASTVLQVLLISALLRSGYKQFPFLFTYAIAQLLTTVIEAAFLIQPGQWTTSAQQYYWADDAIRQILMFCLVISLIYTAMADSPRRSRVRRLLIIASALFALFSLLALREPTFPLWMTKVSRNLSFCAVILNLVLWSALIRNKQRDHRLLMLSGGLGVQMTGEAIGHSLRQLSPVTEWPGNVILILSHFICLYIWWQTFYRESKTPLAARRPQPG